MTQRRKDAKKNRFSFFSLRLCVFASKIFLAVAIDAHSSPVGNPSLPFLLQEGFAISDRSWTNPQCGFIGDYLLQKRLRSCHSSKHLKMHRAQISGPSETALAAWSIRERFNLQAYLGSGQFTYGWLQGDHNILGTASGGLLWGGDAKLIIFNVRDTILAVDAQAGGWDWMSGHAAVDARPIDETGTSKLRYWQIGIACTQTISIFSPYLGLAINRTRFKVSHLPTGTGRMHARHVLGPFVGCSICNASKLLLNVEWRGWFEEGLSASAQLRF